jgi:DNA repair photolyase
MPEQPAFLDLGRRTPTTKVLALRIREEGAASALDQATLRADAARYQEIACRSALNPVQGMPFNWTLNPYRGCTHGCHYCFARRYQTQLELGAGDEFSSVILVKANLVEVLRRELDRPSWTREQVAVGTATDPYQPIEGHYRLTRRALETLDAARTPIGLVTKGPMVVRDRDVLADMGRRAGATVYMSVPTIDDKAWAALEPGTAHPLQRLRAVRQLREAGVNAGVLMAPIVPGFMSSAEQLEATVRAIADHGAAFVGANVMYLKGGTKEHFLGFVAREFPDMLQAFEELYPGAYAPAGYTSTIRAMVQVLQKRYRLDPRGRSGNPDHAELKVEDEQSGPEQNEFDWSPDGDAGATASVTLEQTSEMSTVTSPDQS